MEAARPADADDFDGFYQAHFGDTVAMTYGFTADLAEAQDIAQEAFSRAWQRWAAVSTYDNPVSWVRRVATNLAHSRWRRLKVASAYLVRQRLDDLPELSPDSVDVVTALKRLPVSQRKAIVLHYLMDLPIDVVADELGAPAGTIKSWLYRGRASLSADLSDEVRRVIIPEPPQDLRGKADKKKRARRIAIAATSLVTAVAVGFGLFHLTGPQHDPEPPATPTPSIVPSPEPSPAVRFPTTCQQFPLPLPEGFNETSYVSAADPTGRFIGGEAKQGDQTRLVIWEDGQLRDSFPLMGSSIDLIAINSHGVAIAQAITDANESQGYVFANGNVQRLAGTNVTVFGIANDGRLVGTSGGSPVVWDTVKSSPRLLPMPPGVRQGYATGISEEGLIVGVVGKRLEEEGLGSGQSSLVWLPNGTWQPLKAPASRTADLVKVRGVRGHWAFGVSSAGYLGPEAVLWDLRTGEAIAAGTEWLQDVNELGWMSTNDGDLTLWSHTGDQVTLGDGQGMVTTVNNTGTILSGSGRFAQSVMWRCR
jgi:RNA polymerase sigma-70 factor (sigma-E family)